MRLKEIKDIFSVYTKQLDAFYDSLARAAKARISEIKTPTLYLAGPINARTDTECKEWREYVKTHLPNIKILDPMDRDYRGRELEPHIVDEIVEQDKADIENSETVLVYFDRPSVGTAMEIHFAKMLRKFIVVVDVSDAPLSPWLIYHSDRIVKTLDEAIELLKT